MYKILIFIFLINPVFAQPKLLSLEQATEMALQRSALLKAEQAKIAQAQFQQKSAWNLPAPELQMESPSGVFYTVGAIQNFSFPTVYVRQLQTAKAQTSLATASAQALEQQLRWELRLSYLKAQYAEHLAQKIAEQDSLWQQRYNIVKRLVDAGEISVLDKLLVENRLAAIANQKIETQGLSLSYQKLLEFYVGMPRQDWVLDTFALADSPLATPDPGLHPIMAMYKQNEALKQRALQLEKALQLPSFYIGYLNQGPRTSSIALRFRAGVTLPLWYGLSVGQIKAAKQETVIAAQQTQAQLQATERRLAELQALIQAKKDQIAQFQTAILPKNQQTLAVAERLWRAGEYSYSDYLTLYSDIFNQDLQYAGLLFDYNVLLLEWQYLQGR